MLQETPFVPALRRLARAPLTWVFLAGLFLYSFVVWFDLPGAAGKRYARPPFGLGLHPANWWDEMQGLRGWGSYPTGWYWPLIGVATRGYWITSLGLGLLIGLAAHLLERRAAQHARVAALALAALVVLGYAFEVSTFALKQPDGNQLMLNRVLDDSFNGYFTSATQIRDPSRLFAGYADALFERDPDLRLCGHCRTHPPGPVLFYWIPLQAVEALPAAWQQNLSTGLIRALGVKDPGLPPAQTIIALVSSHVILFGAALIVVPLYGAARLLAGPAYALRLAALGLVLPGLVLMSPELDQLYGVLAACLFYLSLRGLTASRRVDWWGFGAGLVLALGLFGSFGLWVLGAPLLALLAAALTGALGVQRNGEDAPPLSWRQGLTWAVALGLGTALPWLLLWAVGQLDVPRVLEITSIIQLGGTATRRPYGPWLVFNLVDFFQFVGLPLIAVTLLTLIWRRKPAVPDIDSTWPRRLGRWVAGHVNVYGVVFWVVVLALDVSGAVRGEVGRIWIFLMPLALLAVYHAVGRGKLTGVQVSGLIAAQLVVCLLLGGRWLTPVGCCP